MEYNRVQVHGEQTIVLFLASAWRWRLWIKKIQDGHSRTAIFHHTHRVLVWITLITCFIFSSYRPHTIRKCEIKLEVVLRGQLEFFGRLWKTWKQKNGHLPCSLVNGQMSTLEPPLIRKEINICFPTGHAGGNFFSFFLLDSKKPHGHHFNSNRTKYVGYTYMYMAVLILFTPLWGCAQQSLGTPWLHSAAIKTWKTF